MNRDDMMKIAQRIARAPNGEARLTELANLAPDAMLARVGLTHRSSTIGMVLGAAGLVAIGAALGAGTALLLTPVTGKELQTKLRRQAKRVSKDVKRATDNVEERVAEVRDQVSAFAGNDHGSSRRHGAHA